MPVIVKHDLKTIIFTGDKIFVSTPKKLITQLLKKCVGIITGFWNSIYGKRPSPPKNNIFGKELSAIRSVSA